jgi:hypothetical protein
MSDSRLVHHSWLKVPPGGRFPDPKGSDLEAVAIL